MTTYEKIDKWLKQHENFKYHEKSIDQIADYIDWAWKWKKITKAEMENAVDRVCELYNLDVLNLIF